MHFLMTNVLQQQLSYCFTWSSNQLVNLNIFFILFCLSTRFLSALTLESSVIYWLTCFRISGCFLYFFGCYECWLLCINCVMCHTSRITTWATIFTYRLFTVSKEWVKFWSHVFLITYQKSFPKNLLTVLPKIGK